MHGTQREAGFTLLELMVVVTIVGIVAALATLQLTRNPRHDLLVQARHLAAQFEAASDDAALCSSLVAWQPVAGGYRFEVRAGRRWTPLHDAVLGSAHWQGQVDMVEIRNAEPGDPAPRVLFGVEPLGLPVHVTLHSSHGDILISSDGDGRFHAEQVR